MIVILTGGSAFVMWLGERVTDRGVGNGISIILLINIVSTMPNDFKNIYTVHQRQRCSQNVSDRTSGCCNCCMCNHSCMYASGS